jgi:hypothetical protein
MTTMTRKEELSGIYWDAYKDAHGVRPRGIDTSKWTEDQFMLALDDLQRIIDDSESERKEDEARAIVKFEDSVLNLMHTGTNRARVIAWLMQEAGAEGDSEYFCFRVGLPYGYLTRV